MKEVYWAPFSFSKSTAFLLHCICLFVLMGKALCSQNTLGYIHHFKQDYVYSSAYRS